jgi:hypothetical protein
MEDFAFWRSAMFEKKHKDAGALLNSPLFSTEWKGRDGKGFGGMSNLDKGVMQEMFALQHLKNDVLKASNDLNLAVMLDVDPKEIAKLQADYDYAELELQQFYIEDFGFDFVDSSSNTIAYQLARMDYVNDAGDAAETLASGASAQAKQAAMVDMAVAQFDLLEAMGDITGSDIAIPDRLSSALSYQQDSYSVQSASAKFDKAVEAYSEDPSAKNLYSMQIAELELEDKEAEYMQTLAGWVGTLGSLMGGNYKLALKYKEEMTEAKIADLQEKLEAELFLEKWGKYPYGRSENLPSLDTQSAWYYAQG